MRYQDDDILDFVIEEYEPLELVELLLRKSSLDIDALVTVLEEFILELSDDLSEEMFERNELA